MKKITNDSKIHFLEFLTKLIIIGLVFFVIIEIGAGAIISGLYPDITDNNSYIQDFIGHYYCGTFFIEMLISKNFKSVSAYNTYLSLTKIPKIFSYLTSIIAILIIILIFTIFKRVKNKELLKKNTTILIIVLGILYLINNIISEISYLDIRYLKEYATGFLATTTYYPQIYHIFVIPTIIISAGLILKHYELNSKKENTKRTDTTIKIIATFLNKHISIRIPFYGYMMDLPYEYALNQNGYLKLVLFRFIKDLPAFIASSISIVLFIKILLSCINNHINTKDNIKRINISLISLLVSSIILNVLGIFEINILHQNFIEPFNSSVYTIATRSFCEPLIYGLILYFFKIFISTLPKEN